MFQTFLTSHPRRLLESALHGYYHGMMEDVLNDESENISLSQLLDIPTHQLILEEVQHNNRFSAPVSHDELQNQKKIVIVKGDKKWTRKFKFSFNGFFHYVFSCLMLGKAH
jgi:hypothetical protein